MIIDLNYVQKDIHPELEALKERYFDSHPDDPVVLHRKEVMNRKYPFAALRDPKIEREFNTDLLTLLGQWNYTVVTVTLDKLEHKNRYSVWRFHPYHYCLHVLLERYVSFLEQVSSVGDVMSESRGANEDRKLKSSFEKFFDHGTDYLDVNRLQACLSSRQLKVKQKSNNIAGLQLADLLAHPSFKSALASHQNAKQPANFGGQIAQILLRSKYFRSRAGKIEGWGKKWLS
ncbi:DUF3800 domain-containing protein [Anaerolineae bacterium CFX4]|nr:DUF3800 domain-containing protein [Anaerolineae bacterium CFX4]